MPRSPVRVLPDEDQAEFDRLLEAGRVEYAPRNMHEDFMVEQMVWSRWRERRYRRLHLIARETGDDLIAEQMEILANSAERSHAEALRSLRAARKPRRKNRTSHAAELIRGAAPAETAYRA